MDAKPAVRQRRPATDRKFSRIISAAAKVFAKTGFERSSIRIVASRAKVSLAGIYYHVQSKDELLFQIQFNAFETIVNALKEKLDALGAADPAEQLHALIRNHLDYFLNHIEELKVCSRELDTLAAPFYDSVAEVRREYFKTALEIVKKISARDRSRAVDPRTATLCLFGMLNWIYTWYDPGKDTPDSLCDQLLGLYLRGIGQGEVDE